MIILPAVAFAQNNMRKSMFFLFSVFLFSLCVCKCVCFSFSNQAIIVLRHFKLLRSSIMANFQNPNAVCPTKKWVGILSLFINITIIETNGEIKKITPSIGMHYMAQFMIAHPHKSNKCIYRHSVPFGRQYLAQS